MRVALAQVDSRVGDLEHNLARARAAIQEAAEGGAALIVLPELCLSGYAIGAIDRDVSLRADDPALAELAAMAGERALVVGFPELGSGERVYNSAAFFEAGTLRHIHRKLYLPTYGGFEERKHFSAGTTMRAFDTRLGRAAMLICNDAWQPALAFVACQDGAELMIIPANSSRGDPSELDVRAYWTDICRLYARIYQCYVVFVNRVGEERGAHFWGGSQLVDPVGEVVSECPEDCETVQITDGLDLKSLRARRRRVPLNREARLALVRRELDRLIEEGGDL